MAAAYAASFHADEVLLLEKNEKLGKKIYITGKGRGNLTNAADISDFFNKIISQPKFLYSALYSFTNDHLLDLLGKYGLKTKTERGGRIFPISDHASDITAAWTKALKERDVDIKLNCTVKSLILSEAAPQGDGVADFSDNASDKKNEATTIKQTVCGVILSDGSRIQSNHVIVCTGGLSYPTTGSTGDGLRIAQSLGLCVTNTYPALVPLLTKETDTHELAGLSLKNVNFTVKNGKKICYRDFGEMLFTHTGISGPLVLSASSVVTSLLGKGNTLFGEIDFKPRLNEKELDARLLRIIEKQRGQHFKRFFEDLLPASLRPVMVGRLFIAPVRRIGDLSKEERKSIGALLKAFSLTITGTGGFKEAIITQGGVDVKELDPATMKAKRVSGLSFAGEVIDVDALTGGYNMQIAFSTGFLAGDAV